MKLISMKMSRDEAEQEAGIPAPDAADKLPEYPWELRLRLDNESLEKLRMRAEDYKPGQICVIEAKGEVISLSINKDQKGEDRECLEIQITDMDVDWPDKGDEELTDGYDEE